MNGLVLTILFLGVTSFAGFAVIVRLLFIIEDLRLENEKLRIDPLRGD